ncbi:MAG: T9SS type A sorting domain-containing protein, partial [Bacteroidota bacterium]
QYGMWGNPKWSGDRFNGSFANIVRIRNFDECKVSYVAASEGGFAGFNIKTDNPATPKRVKIDVQDCFSAWTESEGFYISYSTSAANQDLTELNFRNNIMAFNGTEALQTDNLVEGSLIQNNVAFVASCFFRRPFQRYQDGLHQFSFVEGGVTVRDNIMITGNTLHQLRFKDPGAGRAFPAVNKPIKFRNNYYGYSRANAVYVWQGDGITPYSLDSMYYGPISNPSTVDAYNTANTWDAYYRICNSNTNISFENTQYPSGRNLYRGICGIASVSESMTNSGTAPTLAFNDSGFPVGTDLRKITFWSAEYDTEDKNGGFIPYTLDDIVFYYDSNGETRFFQCIQAHAANNPPPTSPTYWSEMSWGSFSRPPLDLRNTSNSFFDQRGMGLEYQIASVFPVEWLSFEAKAVDGQAVLEWETASEENNKHFTIERAIDGRLFKPIGRVGSKGMGSYQFVDSEAYTGVFQYRIRQTDFDGSFSFSEIRELKIEALANQLRASIYPNPWQNTLSFELVESRLEPTQVRIYDMQGKLILSRTQNEQSWILQTGKEFAPGLYWVELRQGEQRLQRLIQKLP